ncbi:hypothetical protein PoB_003056800 [Plakobranchus ocellatus]|uniref:Uncharacterized protein n=1 Tax=Plakobranchus ocellatus TaxID=259542 RepID=A0AAV4ABU2_9GAST|nr:hypothetical protein PoB_003056800 [Plakobranchus ocellatus]
MASDLIGDCNDILILVQEEENANRENDVLKSKPVQAGYMEAAVMVENQWNEHYRTGPVCGGTCWRNESCCGGAESTIPNKWITEKTQAATHVGEKCKKAVETGWKRIYINSKGVTDPKRQMVQVACDDCRNKCSEKIREEDRKAIFEDFWSL